MYILNNAVFLDSWNKTLKLLDILLIESCPECLHSIFLHDIVRVSYHQEPKMKVIIPEHLLSHILFVSDL